MGFCENNYFFAGLAGFEQFFAVAAMAGHVPRLPRLRGCVGIFSPGVQSPPSGGFLTAGLQTEHRLRGLLI
jgi:hypothetical protein